MLGVPFLPVTVPFKIFTCVAFGFSKLNLHLPLLLKVDLGLRQTENLADISNIFNNKLIPKTQTVIMGASWFFVYMVDYLVG